MNKYIKIFIALFAISSLAGCYDKFESPSPNSFKVYTDADFADSQIIPIHDLKQKFYDKYGKGQESLAKTLVIEEDLVVKGKVISSDEQGNVYKSLYIFDGTEGIEVKLTTGNYVFYQPGETVYVKVKGLAIGSYRYNLSIGLPPSATDVKNGYANANIEQRYIIKKHVFEGEAGKITDADIVVVNESNYTTILNDDMLGRLVKFEGLTSHFGDFVIAEIRPDGTEYIVSTDKFPNFLETIYSGNNAEPTYTTKYYTDEGKPNTWAYSYGNNKYYGSAWFGYGTNNRTNVGNYIVRTSGYAKFALKALPKDGKKVNITGIYTKYSSRSGGFIKYQILLNDIADVTAVD